MLDGFWHKYGIDLHLRLAGLLIVLHTYFIFIFSSDVYVRIKEYIESQILRLHLLIDDFFFFFMTSIIVDIINDEQKEDLYHVARSIHIWGRLF